MALQMTWVNAYRRKSPPLGLRNLGNSCYLNSVLQCLTYTPPLANFCLSNRHSSICELSNAAKLRRAAAAKEKELAQYQELRDKDKSQSPDFYLANIKKVKGVIYVGLIWWFWSTSVAVIPAHLLQPFGKLLFWGGGSSAGNTIRVGIIPWLVLTNRVSEFAIRKLSVVSITHLNRLQAS